MSKKFVISSSLKDSHGVNFTKTMLEEGVASINGEKKMRYLVNHRREYPLLGCLDNAEVIEKDNVYLLMTEAIMYTQKEEVYWDTELIAERTAYPIQIQRRKPADQDFVITLDPNNFGSPKQYLVLEQALKDELQGDLEIKTDTRKGFIPEPRIIFSLAMAAPIWHLTKPLLKKVGEKIADDIGDAVYEAGKKMILSLAHKTKQTMLITRQRALPQNKPLSLVFELHGEPYIELHAKTNDVNLVAKGLSINQLSKIKKRVNELCEHVKIIEAHFDLSKKGSWVFSYLITEDGVQIGKKSLFKKRDKLIERIKLNPQYGHSIGADVTYEYRTISNIDKSKQA